METVDLVLGSRDAVHVPFVVVECSDDLEPGQKVSLRDPATSRTLNHGFGSPLRCVIWDGGGTCEPEWHGVVDPFLDGKVSAGTLFRCMIRPGFFSSFRHTFRIETHDSGGTSTCSSVCDIV